MPKFVSRSDPAAQWIGAHKGHAFFAYADNYLIDLKVAIIVDVEATRAIRQAEVGAARTMINRTEDRLSLRPERLAADSAYGSAEMLGWLVDERAMVASPTSSTQSAQSRQSDIAPFAGRKTTAVAGRNRVETTSRVLAGSLLRDRMDQRLTGLRPFGQIGAPDRKTWRPRWFVLPMSHVTASPVSHCQPVQA